MAYTTTDQIDRAQLNLPAKPFCDWLKLDTEVSAG